MLSDTLAQHMRAQPPHIARLWTLDIETQILWQGERQPTRIKPDWTDTAYDDIDRAQRIGVSGWDHVNGRSVYGTIDLDNATNHSGGLPADELESTVDRLKLIDELEIDRSTSGQGYHVRVYFDPENLPRATTRKEHGERINRVVRWIADKTGIDLVGKRDVAGYMAWVWATDVGPRGFELVKESTRYLPESSHAIPDEPATYRVGDDGEWIPQLPPGTVTATKDYDPQVTLTSKQRELVDWLASRQLGELKDGRLQTHTHHLATAKAELNVKGDYDTLATGKGGAADRNCFCHANHDGSWTVYRHHKGTKEAAGWQTSANGFTFCRFGGERPRKQDAAQTIVELGMADELFRDADGGTYAQADGSTLTIGEAAHQYRLREAYRNMTGLVATREGLKTAIEELKSIAYKGETHKVGVRIIHHDGAVYLDLDGRNVVKVTADGWQTVSSAPVRFRRPAAALPLPMPQPGGTLADLRRFFTIADDDMPLLLAFIMASYSAGPYCLLQLVGEQGSAKTSTAVMIHQLLDPIEKTEHFSRDLPDLMVMARHRHLLSFDNLDGLTADHSRWLCCMSTGAALSRRALYSNDDISNLRAQRPVILTSRAEVVTAPDLMDRTITIHLPAGFTRRPEHEIKDELTAAHPRLLGYILDGVSAAIRNRDATTIADTRMMDAYQWATAAEPGLGLPAGSIMAAHQLQTWNDAASVIAESAIANSVMALANKGWQGTATDLAKALGDFHTPREASDELRKIMPNLRQLGYQLTQRTLKGRTVYHLSCQNENHPSPGASSAAGTSYM